MKSGVAEKAVDMGFIDFKCKNMDLKIGIFSVLGNKSMGSILSVIE